MKFFASGNPIKKLAAIFAGAAQSPAPAPVPDIPADDPLATAKQTFFDSIRLEDMEILEKTLDRYPEAVTWREDAMRFEQTGLIVAAQHNCPRAARLLCERGADVAAVDTTGCNALITAAGKLDTGVVKALLAHQSPLEAESGTGETALLAAIKHLQRVQTLVETQPHLAPTQRNIETIRLLVEAGADPARKNKNGQDAYTLAETLQDKEVYLGLLGAKQKQIDNADIQAGKKPVIRLLKPLRLKQ